MKKSKMNPLKKKGNKKALPLKTPAKAAKKITVRKTIAKVSSKTIINMLLKEMEQEAITTRKMLKMVPEDKWDWKPHEKSMTLQRLATHLAELPSWASMAINTDELDFEASKYVPLLANTNAELLAVLEKSLASGKASLNKASDDMLSSKWVMRSGKTIFSISTKGEVIRMAYCQIVHHRAQLGVYLRLLNIPIPGSYGPSADDNRF